MRRINYLISRSERTIGFALPRALPPSLRAPLVAAAAALTIVGVAHAVAGARLSAANRDGERYADRLVRTEARVAGLRATEREVDALRAMARRADELRRSGPRAASTIAAIGNRFPRDARISALRIAGNGYTLDGRGTAIAAVGSTIDALSRLPSLRTVRLVSVRANGERGAVTYALALERAR
jgi:Tfp pilus assembly protein PilN